MKSMKANEALRQMTARVYAQRPAVNENLCTNYRIERVNGGYLCDLWFLTTGCRHDMQGGCVMCNYGKGCGKVDQERILRELQRIVRGLSLEFEDFLLTSSGSLLDEREVFPSMRVRLAELLKQVKAKRFVIETRVNTITDEGIAFVKEAMPAAEAYIEFGVESSDDWILKHCVNKGMMFKEFQKAAEKLHGEGIKVIANIGLGIPFMTERAAIKSTVQSVKDVFEAGADCVVLFPYHIKSGTLLEVMYQKGLYRPVSLWTLAEVLSQFSKEQVERIQISWYKDYFESSFSHILHSPSTCSRCQEEVMTLLDRYRDCQDYACIHELRQFSCECKQQWKEQLMQQSDEIEIHCVENAYRTLAEDYLKDQELLEREIQGMYQDFARR